MTCFQKYGPIVKPEELSDDVRIKVYDFKRPDKFSKEQIRTVSIIHETFARLLTTQISALLRQEAHLHCYSVDQLTYEEFIRSIPNPTVIGIVDMAPIRGSAVIEIDPSISFAMLQRLFGGNGDIEAPDRDITDVECAVMEGFISRMLNSLRESWKPLLNLQPSLGQIETNPMFAQIVPPTEMILLVTLEAKLPHANGYINFCIPYLTIEPIIHKLSAMYMYSTVRRGLNPLSDGRDTIPAETRITLDGPCLTIAELASLKEGSLIPLESLDIQQDEDMSPYYLEVGGSKIVDLERDDSSWHFTVAKEIQYLIAPGMNQKTEIKASSDNPEEMVRHVMKGLESKLGKILDAQTQIADTLSLGNPSEVEPSRPGKTMRIGTSPFGFVRNEDCSFLSDLLANELPQLCALVISYLEPSLGACVLSNFPEEKQPKVIRQIVTMDRVDPVLLSEIEKVFERKLTPAMKEEATPCGGTLAAVEILNHTSRHVEKNVIEFLEQHDSELSEQIKMRMFVFEDIVLLDLQARKKIFDIVKDEDIALAIKGVEQEVIEKVLEVLPEQRKTGIRELQKGYGAVRIKDVEMTHQKIINIIRSLEENGDIIVARQDDLIIE